MALSAYLPPARRADGTAHQPAPAPVALSFRNGRRVRTTVPEPVEQKVPDLLNRDFTAAAPNQRYVGDITYLPIAGGTNLYPATVIDCYSRWARRGDLPLGQGSVYTSKDDAELRARLGVTQSMGAILVPVPEPHRVRDPHRRYAPVSGVIPPCVGELGQGPR